MTAHRLLVLCTAIASATGLVGDVRADTRADAPELPEPSAALQARSPHNLDPYAAAQLPVLAVRRAVAPALTPADTLAIHELISRVYLAEDSVDRDALRDAVTPDFILEDAISGRTLGRDAFADLMVKSATSRAGSRRMALNIAVSPDGENRAIAVHYFLSVKVFSPATKSPDLQLQSQGIVRDQLIKDKATWRLVRRISDQISVDPARNFNVTRRIQAARVITPNERM